MSAIFPEEKRNVVHIPVIDHFRKQDYEQFVPRINELVQEHGKIRILFDLARFQGWTEGAQWFSIGPFPDVERIAFVGDTRWEKGVGNFGQAFKKAQVRYFDHGCKDQAMAWVEEDDRTS